jgi:hypothetical protein
MPLYLEAGTIADILINKVGEMRNPLKPILTKK